LSDCHIASSAKNPENVFTALHNFGLPDTPDAHQFVAELFGKVPRKQKHKSTADAARKQAEEAKALRSQKFGFLLEDEGAHDVVHVAKKAKGRKKGTDRSENASTMVGNGKATKKRRRGKDGRARMNGRRNLRQKQRWTHLKMRMLEKKGKD
jgi:pre-mRNA-splicing factor ATP-dependent RNA helicase DHX16